MKQSIPTPVVVAAVAVVLVAVVLLGFKALGGGRTSGPSQQSMMERMKQNAGAMAPMRSGGIMRSGGMSGGMSGGTSGGR